MLLRQAMILPPYVRPLRRVPRLAIHLLCYAALVLFSLIYGYFIVILPPQLLFIPATPLIILCGLILWALPDTDRIPRAVSVGVLGFFLASNYIWPAYVAINLPGIPWLNPQRIALFLLFAAGVYGYANSSKLRRETMEVARTEPIIWKAFVVFWFCSLVALAFAGSSITFSINRWANHQIYWTFMFFIAAYLVRKEGSMLTLAKALMIAGIITSLFAIPEYINKKVPWVDYIPNFLIGDPIIFERVRSDQARLNLDMYRARSSFGVSLSFAEFLALALPFFLHAFAEERALLKKLILLAATVLLATAMAILTGARSGMIGLIIGVFGYGAFWTFRRWRTQPHDIIGAAAVTAIPVLGAAFIALTLAWRRLYVMVIGGGQHQYSNMAREVQWNTAFAKLLENPIGYGEGTVGEVIGYTNPAGELTVDSYYITLLIHTGVLGFIAFYVFTVATIIAALKMSFLSKDKETLLAAPIAVALTSLLVIKSVLSQPENLPILFIFAGAVCALSWRAKQRAAQT